MACGSGGYGVLGWGRLFFGGGAPAVGGGGYLLVLLGDGLGLVTSSWFFCWETVEWSRSSGRAQNGKLQTGLTVRNLNKGPSGKPRTSTSKGRLLTVIQAFTQSPKKSQRWCSCEIGVRKTSVYHILWLEKCGNRIQRLLLAWMRTIRIVE
jgi:hypothetical protein